MKLLIMTGPLFPQPGNNANLIGKLVPHFRAAGHEVHLFSDASGAEAAKLPAASFGVPVHWSADQKRDWKRKLLYPSIAKAVDPKGFSDALQVQILLRELRELRRQFPFDAAVASSEPYPVAVAASQLSGVKKALYIMDPPACISGGTETAFRNRVLPSLLIKHDALITTPFIKEALEVHGYTLPAHTETVGFPMITENHTEEKRQSEGRIRLLYCGWLYSDIRSPRYFLDLLSRLDERFEVTFMGKECERLQERFPTETKATVITLPNQPYEIALKAMADADVLVNIGNSVPVHMPSKTLEYINTGKPLVNFYKLEECPTLYYTKRYPLALNLYEGDRDMDAAAARFVRFCEETVGKTVERSFIESEYADCTPGFIAGKIIEILESCG